jgi:MarR family transcriptional repressor of mepA
MIPDIGVLVKQTDITLSRQMNQFASQYGLTGVQMSFIDFLGRLPEHRGTQKELENEFNIQRSTTTIILQRMEKRDLIVREIDPHDRRRRSVKLTHAAIELFPVVRDYISHHQQKLLEHFSVQDLQTTVKILKYLQEENNEPTKG